MKPTDQLLLAIDEQGPITQIELQDKFPELRPETIRNCVVGLARRGMIRKIGMEDRHGRGGAVAIWEAAECEPKPDSEHLVASALANRHPLETVWQ